MGKGWLFMGFNNSKKPINVLKLVFLPRDKTVGCHYYI